MARTVMSSQKTIALRDNEHLRPQLGLRAGLWVALPALLLAVPACSGGDQKELFEETRVALAANVGDECEVDGASMPDETIVEDNDPTCGTGVCLWSHPEIEPGTPGVPGLCTCHCDGSVDEGPFCACPENYACVFMIEDIGIGSEYSGSYCLPE